MLKDSRPFESCIALQLQRTGAVFLLCQIGHEYSNCRATKVRGRQDSSVLIFPRNELKLMGVLENVQKFVHVHWKVTMIDMVHKE